MKKFFALLALIVAVNFSVANAQVPAVTDQTNSLDATQIKSLDEKIHSFQSAHKIKIGIAFVNSVGMKDIVQVAKEMLRQNFANSSNGSIVFLVDMGSHRYEIATDARMSERITDIDGIPFLKKKIEPSLRSGDYSGACNNFVDSVNELVTYYETNGEAYSSLNDGFDSMAAIGAVIIAVFGGVFFRSVLISSMSNVHHALTATDYLQRSSVKITENRDTFLFRNVKRRPRGGGGGGSRGGSSGSSSGGGGGGSF